MTDLAFTVAEIRAVKEAAVPTLAFRLRIEEPGGVPVHAVVLRCRIQIEPRRRTYGAGEQRRLMNLHGEPGRWRDVLRPLFWTESSIAVPGFSAGIEVDVPVACTGDFEVTAARYLQTIEGGDVPLLFVFSGTAFVKRGNGLEIQPLGRESEVACRMPLRVWREAMQSVFPGCGWVRLRHESLDALERFKSRRALSTLDDAIETLIANAGEPAA
jgi:hypothetical protein